MKTVLITGAAGYLGSHLAKTFKLAGWKVVGFGHKRHTMNHYIDIMHYGDIRDRELLESLFHHIKFDLVIHTAARIEAGISVNEPTEFYDVNVGGTTNLLNVMTHHGVKDIIFCSTAAVYKTQDRPITEDDEIANNSPYGFSKYLAEEAIKASKLNYVIFRFFNLTGADPEGEFGESHEPETHLIPRLILNMDNIEIYGTDYDTKDGTCVRDYVHVTDIAEAHLEAAKYLEKGGESDIFNLGTGHGYTILEVIRKLENVAGRNINYKSNPRREGDAMSLIADTKKATLILKYTPKYDLVSILNTAYEWHKHG